MSDTRIVADESTVVSFDGAVPMTTSVAGGTVDAVVGTAVDRRPARTNPPTIRPTITMALSTVPRIQGALDFLFAAWDPAMGPIYLRSVAIRAH